MKEQNNEAGAELLFLLRQQRRLYHQFKMLSDRQRQLAGTDSPEQLLEVVFGRRENFGKAPGTGRETSANKSELAETFGPNWA